MRYGRLPRFAVVGASGVAVNSGVLAALTSMLRWWYLPASLLATEAAILWNFALSERCVFDHSGRAHPLRARLAGFVLVNTGLALVGSPLLVALVSLLSVNVLAANAVCLAVLCLIRFVIADRWIWAPGRAQVAGEREPALITTPLTTATVSREP
jgi:dolichol-phosphate mannosyltransferase